MLFEADPDDISRLDSTQLVQLMKRLLHAECRLVGIPLRQATVPLQVTVADGGEDGRVEWNDGVGSTDFFPARFCVFQSKAQNLIESILRKEIIKSTKAKRTKSKGDKKLNAAVAEAIERKGAYVVFCSKPFINQKLDKLRITIAKAIRECKGKPSRLAKIDIYDANRIADWVNTHPPVALWLAAVVRGRSALGLLSHEGWGHAEEISSVKWISDNGSRYVTTKPKGDRVVWDFNEASRAVLDYLSSDGAVVRLAGPSGFGKSRFAYEIFNRAAGTADFVERTELLYADATIIGDEVSKLALEIADGGFPATLVVDDCHDDLHAKLVGIVKRKGSRLRLVTIDIETRVQDALVIRLEPAPNEMIGAIARSIFPELTSSDTNYITELSQGFPKIAVLAARQQHRGAPAVGSAQDVLKRVLFGGHTPVEEALKALQCASLFDWVGLQGQASTEAEFIAEKVAGLGYVRFVEHIKSFIHRGVINERGDHIQVAPIPLAASLASQRLELFPSGWILQIFLQAPAELKKSILRRMRWLDSSSEVRSFGIALLHVEHLARLDALNSEAGSEYLDLLVHIAPDAVMGTIEGLLRPLSKEQLREFQTGRRHLVWALEKLAFRKQTFEAAATCLRRLATAETEEGIGNNATGQFTQLYQLYLSGTEAPPSDRLCVLDEGLASTDSAERRVCMTALDSMLQTDHFSRGGGAAEIGSGAPLKDWAPQSWDEIQSTFREAIKRLLGIAVSEDAFASVAKQILGSHIRGLIGRLPTIEIDALISRVTQKHGFWPSGLAKLNEWLYFDRKDRPAELGNEVRSLFEKFLPKDPIDAAVYYTHGWEGDVHDPDTNYDPDGQLDMEYMSRKAAEQANIIVQDESLVLRCLDTFVLSEGQTVLPFAQELGYRTSNVKRLFQTAICRVPAGSVDRINVAFFQGIIAGAEKQNSKTARECIAIAMKAEPLKKHAVAMIGSGQLRPQDIRLVASLLRSGEVKPWQCAHLSYGKRMEHLQSVDVLPLLQALSRKGAEGLWAAIDIVSTILHDGRELIEPLRKYIQTVLVDTRLFQGEWQRDTMRGYRFGRMVEQLSRRNAVDKGFAGELTKRCLAVVTQGSHVFYQAREGLLKCLKTVIQRQPAEVWKEFRTALVRRDRLFRHRIDMFLNQRDDTLGPGLLFGIPPDLYLPWVRKKPEERAAIVMTWLPITTRYEDGTLSWHAALEGFVEEFGQEASIYRVLDGRLHPIWRESTAADHKEEMSLLEAWTVHKMAETRSWARSRLTAIKALG